MQKRVVVGGAGFGGLAAALSLARQMPELEVVLVDAQRCHVYTPWLYEVATGFLFEGRRNIQTFLRRGAQVPYEEIIRYAPKNLRFRQGRVAKIDAQTKHFIFEDGISLKFDTAVLAFGSEGEDYGIPGVKEYGMPLKSIVDGVHIEERLGALLEEVRLGHRERARVVIGGAGAAGVETASELAHGMYLRTKHDVFSDAVQVMLVDAAPTILGMFSQALQRAASTRARKLGVDLRMSERITNVASDVITTDKGEIPYDLFLWTGGIRPNRLTATSSLMRDPRGRLLTNAFGQAQEHPDLFVVGDGALLIDPRTGKPVPPAAWAAMQEGKQVGMNVARMLSGVPLKTLVFPRVYPAVVTVGGHYSVATVLGISFSGFWAFVLRRLVDFHYFLSILPFRVAIKLWYRGADIFENNTHV